MDDVGPERIARTAFVFRDANEGIRASAARHGVTDRVPFVCECANPACTDVIRLSLMEYDEIRGDATLFLNAPGHVAAAGGSAEVADGRETYDVVRTIGRASAVAHEHDPPCGVPD